MHYLYTALTKSSKRSKELLAFQQVLLWIDQSRFLTRG